ncbi:MAG: uracil phosphoribosyltransferase, partial [Verrucomicrobiota bacterium]|nr:uracil phosphoribosyltransferase [Verrucomicrobiota bacterium]
MVAVRLAALRNRSTGLAEFRQSLQALSVLLLAEASRAWVTTQIEVETPLQTAAGVAFAKPVALVPILRAGVGMLDGMLQMLP